MAEHVVDTAREVIEQFNDAFNRHDVDAIMALRTDHCVFENASPAPDGTRHEGAGGGPGRVGGVVRIEAERTLSMRRR